MNLIQAVISGVVQGITEFFPISSSGHLVLLHHIFGLSQPQLSFDIFLHLGTTISVLIFFRKDLLNLFTRDRKTLILLVVGSVPTFIIGILFKDILEGLFGMPKIVGGMILVTGFLLITATLYHNYLSRRGIKRDLGITNSIAIGIAQGIAITPGISRSGSTIAAGMLAGLDKETAFRFSFLLSIPAVLGAAVLKAHKIGAEIMSGDSVFFLIGGATALITGLFAVKVLLKLVKKNMLHFFGIYCILAGSIIMFSVR